MCVPTDVRAFVSDIMAFYGRKEITSSLTFPHWSPSGTKSMLNLRNQILCFLNMLEFFFSRSAVSRLFPCLFRKTPRHPIIGVLLHPNFSFWLAVSLFWYLQLNSSQLYIECSLQHKYCTTRGLLSEFSPSVGTCFSHGSLSIFPQPPFPSPSLWPLSHLQLHSCISLFQTACVQLNPYFKHTF